MVLNIQLPSKHKDSIGKVIVLFDHLTTMKPEKTKTIGKRVFPRTRVEAMAEE